MGCTDDVARLIPWYAAGTLESAERSRVESHLRSCAECRRALALASEVVQYAKQHSPESLAEHVHAELLTDFVLRRERLDGGVADWIERHLETCDDCSGAAAIVGEMSLDAEEQRSASPTVMRSMPWTERAWRWLASTVLRPGPALAYLILLVVSFPLYRVLQPGGDTPPTPSPSVIGAAGPLHIDFLKSSSRGAAGAQRVVLDDERPFVYLGLEPRLSEDVAPEREYLVEIAAGATPVWSHRLTAAEIRNSLESDQLALVLAVPASAVPPGTYDLRLIPAGEGEPILRLSFETGPELP